MNSAHMNSAHINSAPMSNEHLIGKTKGENPWFTILN